MTSFSDYVSEYRKELGKGRIQAAYRGLMKFMSELKAYFNSKYPELDASGGLYPGYMDMTYFALVPASLKSRKLKIAVVFIHETASFQVWLAGVNKQVQAEYYDVFKGKEWGEHRVSAPGKGVDSILEYDLDAAPDFNDLEALKTRLADGTLKFISDVEGFLLP